MKIYKFQKNYLKLFRVEEIEVEEKPKTYVARGLRVNKEDIGKILNHYGNEMYRLDNDPKPYIEAMIERCKSGVTHIEKRLEEAKSELARWEEAAKEV